jgi:geranylgeranyl diphosphate synthase type II
MDNDDFRRGRPSLHRAFPEGQAVLSGDFLLTYAFELLATCSILTPKQKVTLIAELAQAAGSNGMIGGQVVDIATKGEKLSEELMLFTHSKKTAALIAASLVFGGILAEASEEEIEVLRLIGSSFGIAFQLSDDLTDGQYSISEVRMKELIDQHYHAAVEKLCTLSGNMSGLETLFAAILCKAANV